MRRGITLVELLVVIAIAAIVMAILTPALVSAKRSGQVASSVQILRQLHLTTKLYQFDYDGDGRYGDFPEMGIPSSWDVALLSPTGSIYLSSPCGQNPMWAAEPVAFDYIYRVGLGGPEFAEAARKYRENLLLFYDPNCDEPGYPIWDESKRHFGIGVLLSGQAVRKRAIGKMYFDDSWWTRPPED